MDHLKGGSGWFVPPWSAGCSGGSAAPELSGSCPSEGADPGEAQPGVSFIVAPSRCPSAVAAAGWQPSCHGVPGMGPAPVWGGHLQLSACYGADWADG